MVRFQQQGICLALIGLGLVTAAARSAQAGCTVPFTIIAPVGVTPAKVSCGGPWGRESSCSTVKGGADNFHVFYCADQTIFSMWESWNCGITATCDNLDDTLAKVDFCIESTGPSRVDLSWDGASTLTLVEPAPCTKVEVAGFLGHATSMAGGDRDTFDIPGRSGERFRVRLEQDGTTGGAGEVATLEVESKSGARLERYPNRRNRFGIHNAWLL
jgi:hypothetical protein